MNQGYYRPRPMWGPQFVSTMIGKLILINVVVFVIQRVFFPTFDLAFALRPRAVVENFYLWQLVTYMFLHGSFSHLFWNMLMLWMFGSTIESVWGSRNFLRYYLFCGIGGAIFAMVFSYNTGVIGASGAIFGIYVAYAIMFPENHIYLWFVVPVKAKYLVTGIAAFQLIQGISGPSGISYVAHLGGIVAALLFFRHELVKRARFYFGTRRRWKAHVSQTRADDERHAKQDDHETDNIDSILDKISAKGYENLTTTEKKILEHYSRKRKEENE